MVLNIQSQYLVLCKIKTKETNQFEKLFFYDIVDLPEGPLSGRNETYLKRKVTLLSAMIINKVVKLLMYCNLTLFVYRFSGQHYVQAPRYPQLSGVCASVHSKLLAAERE
jgi:hypothetical protein